MLPTDLPSLYDWTPSSKRPYAEFLRARPSAGPLHYAIDTRNRELIASDQELSARGFEVLSVNLEREFAMLSKGGAQVGAAGQEPGAESVPVAQAAEPAKTAEIAEAAGSFSWGFVDQLISQGQMNIALDELLKLTKAVAPSWACEQFESGCAAFRRGMYKEALQAAMRAIEGQANNAGIKTEFRFHFLVGIIRLGSHSNSSTEVINPPLAQQAFLAAARCAEAACPEAAGQSLICAGRAAFLDGEFDNAIAYTRKGLELVPAHAAGLYQLGRALFMKGARKEACERLADAIMLNVEFALHASGDADFIAKIDFLNDALRQAHERYEARFRQMLERFRRARQKMLDFSFMEVPAADLPLKGLAEIKEIPKSVEATAEAKTLFAYAAALNRLLAGFELFPPCFEDFKQHCVRRLKERIVRAPLREDYFSADVSDDSKRSRGSAKAGLASGIVSGIAVFFMQSSQLARPIYRGIVESMSDLFLLPLVSAVGIAVTVAFVGDIYREYNRSKYKSALAAFEAASYTYRNLKNSLEKEIASIQDMSLPVECQSPIKVQGGKHAAARDQVPEQRRSNAWSKLK